MNDAELNAAIAEKCGWRRIRLGTQLQNDPEPRGWLPPKTNDWRHGRERCPSFCSDLNAMHEAEKALADPLLAWRYVTQIWKVIQPKEFANYNIEKHVCATARQRAEAFARTVGIWKE